MSVALWRKIEGACLVIELPLARWQLRIYLANPALPMRLLPGDFMPPEGIDINHRECRILFVGDPLWLVKINRNIPDHFLVALYWRIFHGVILHKDDTDE